jgi:hypothetical protein
MVGLFDGAGTVTTGAATGSPVVEVEMGRRVVGVVVGAATIAVPTAGLLVATVGVVVTLASLLLLGINPGDWPMVLLPDDDPGAVVSWVSLFP